MRMQLSEFGIVKKQNFDIDSPISIIYGYNNSGKTTMLKVINNMMIDSLLQAFLMGKQSEISAYIPTNRLSVSDANTERIRISDLEDLIHYQKDALNNYALHLRNLRNMLLSNDVIESFILKAVKKIFSIEIQNLSNRYSDGIENVINIYLNIVWMMIWKHSIYDLNEEQFNNLISEQKIYVLIDEIEMFLHVNSQSKLIDNLREDFPKCFFVLTTHSPLILTRCKNANIYNIIDGVLEPILKELYYKDLDTVYEALFYVEELPKQIQQSIRYLGRVIKKEEKANKVTIEQIAEKMMREYYNLFMSYNPIIIKAQSMVEDDGKA